MADDDDKESMIAKVIGIGVAFAAAWAAQQVIAGVWKATVGHKPPKPEDEGDARFAEIAVAAAVTGAVVALSRAMATRGAAKFLS